MSLQDRSRNNSGEARKHETFRHEEEQQGEAIEHVTRRSIEHVTNVFGVQDEH